ncbi:MAG: proton-conducting transporter membrane subunit [Chloroflexota bacterium]
MSAPVLWIFAPFGIGVAALFLRNQRVLTVLSGSLALLLTFLAFLIPIDQALLVAGVSFKISPSIQILGRSLTFLPAEGSLLVIVYGLIAMWLFGAEVAGVAHRLAPLGLMIASLLVASIAVEPFLYAAVLIEMAVLLAVPMLLPPNQAPGPGLMRFLIYQTLAMPFILFSGWLLAGVEASPGDLALAVQSATILGLGFAFLLAIFPLYTWLPMLVEETIPYLAGFLFWILPTIAIVFGMGFLDRYSWLRASAQLAQGLQWGGLLMVVTGGLWSAFERHLGRQMAYGVIAEIGFSLLALSLPAGKAVEAVFLLVIPRSLAFLVWALSLTEIQRDGVGLRFSAVKGMARVHPIVAAGLVLAHFSVAGFPLLAGFPIRLALWEGLAAQSLNVAFGFLVGVLGLLTGATRTLAVLVIAPQGSGWELRERWGAGILIGVGVLGLFVLGVFPQVTRLFLAALPAMFEHLGR